MRPFGGGEVQALLLQFRVALREGSLAGFKTRAQFIPTARQLGIATTQGIALRREVRALRRQLADLVGVLCDELVMCTSQLRQLAMSALARRLVRSRGRLSLLYRAASGTGGRA